MFRWGKEQTDRWINLDYHERWEKTGASEHAKNCQEEFKLDEARTHAIYGGQVVGQEDPKGPLHSIEAEKGSDHHQQGHWSAENEAMGPNGEISEKTSIKPMIDYL